MEFICNVQRNLCKTISRAFFNFKKYSDDRLTSELIEAKIETLENDWMLFRENNAKLYTNYELEDIEKSTYAQCEVYEDTEENYCLYKALLRSTLKNMSPDSSTAKSQNRSSSQVKLPKIIIPVFSGKYEEWTTFRDLFVSLVHKNSSLDNVQRLHYLKAHLAGEAEQLIRHTPIADANYDRCWELLEKRYNNKKFLSNSVLNKLFQQRAINVESASALKELLDVSTDCLSALKCLGIDVSTWDVIIIHIVSSKLDPETRKQWELTVSSPDKNQNELPTLAQLQAFIESRFRALEFVEPARDSTVQKMNSLSQSVPEKKMSSPIPCEFCAEGHKLGFCKKFTNEDIEFRREFVTKNNICFNCLGSNHSVYHCRKPTVCRICGKRHHTMLHVSSESKRVDASNEDVENTVASCHTAGELPVSSKVLLPTALVNAEARSGEYHPIRALLDQGSQACFITEATAQILQLKRIPVDGKISSLGQADTRISHEVQTTIQSRTNPRFKMKIRAYVIKSITSYRPERNMENRWLNVEEQRLADPKYNMPQRVDLLLGADVYGRILTEGIKKSPTGTLLAQNTSLGWILSGVSA